MINTCTISYHWSSPAGVEWAASAVDEAVDAILDRLWCVHLVQTLEPVTGPERLGELKLVRVDDLINVDVAVRGVNQRGLAIELRNYPLVVILSLCIG